MRKCEGERRVWDSDRVCRWREPQRRAGGRYCGSQRLLANPPLNGEEGKKLANSPVDGTAKTMEIDRRL